MPNTISESLKTQYFFNLVTNNSDTPLSILPDTNTALKQSLQAKYPTAVISSYLEIKLLELRVKLTSINEYSLPESAVDGVSSPVAINRDLVQSLWNNPRKQLNVYHKLGNTPDRLRGSLSLLNKGDVNAYYLEDFLGVLTTGASYPVSSDEDILIGLIDGGYGLLLGADEILFTGVFTHYLTITNDAYLTVNGGVVELATFDQAQAIINLLGTGTNNTPILNAITALQTNLTTRLNTLDNSILDLKVKIDNLVVSGGVSPNPNPTPTGFTKSYNSASPVDDLINLLGTNNGTVTYANPHPTKITSSASSIAAGVVTSLTSRTDEDFYTTDLANSWIRIDLTSIRTVKLTGIGIKNRANIYYSPTALVIEGSNDGTNFTAINSWNSIGFTVASQWKYTTFVESPSYRYIRIRQPGGNIYNTNELGVTELNLYGTISAL